MQNIKQKAREMFDEKFGEIQKYHEAYWGEWDSDGYSRAYPSKITDETQNIKNFIDQIIDLAIAERDKDIVKMMYIFIRNGEFSGSFADGCDCKECDKYEIKSKKKFINLINNIKTYKQ